MPTDICVNNWQKFPLWNVGSIPINQQYKDKESTRKKCTKDINRESTEYESLTAVHI